MSKQKANSIDNPWIISYGSADYDGREIPSKTPMHDARAVHKYKLGLFVTALIAMSAAIVDIVLIVLTQLNGQPLPGLSSGITTASIVFVITLLVDIIFTINLNKYVNDKRWLILYIPAFVLMVIFSVPQLLTLLTLFGIKLPTFSYMPDWANYVNIFICGVYIVAEIVRIILHWNDLDIKQEVRKALR